MGIWGLRGDEDSFISEVPVAVGLCEGVARGAREVLSSSAAEAAAATRMDFLSHPNSTVQRCSPQSGGIPPASDAAVAAAPRGPALGETNCSVGVGRKGKYPLKGQRLTLSHQR